MSRKDFVAGYMAAKRDMRKAEWSSGEIYDEAERLVSEYGDMLKAEFDRIEQSTDDMKQRAVEEFEYNVKDVIRGGIEQAGNDFNQQEFERYVIDDLASQYRPGGWSFNFLAAKRDMRKTAFGGVEDWVSIREHEDFRNNEFGPMYYQVNWKAVGDVSVEEAREFASLILDMCDNPERYAY